MDNGLFMDSNHNPTIIYPICSMVLEYLPTLARTKSPSFVGKYTGAMDIYIYIYWIYYDIFHDISDILMDILWIYLWILYNNNNPTSYELYNPYSLLDILMNLYNIQYKYRWILYE